MMMIIVVVLIQGRQVALVNYKNDNHARDRESNYLRHGLASNRPVARCWRRVCHYIRNEKNFFLPETIQHQPTFVVVVSLNNIILDEYTYKHTSIYFKYIYILFFYFFIFINITCVKLSNRFNLDQKYIFNFRSDFYVLIYINISFLYQVIYTTIIIDN